MKVFKEKIQQLLPEICIMAFFSIMLIFLGPLESIAANVSSFDLTPKEASRILIPLSICVFLVSVIILYFIPQKIRNFLSSLIFAGCIICYLQANFLNPDIGFLDDDAIDWNLYVDDMKINLVIWGAIGIAVIIATIFIKHFTTIKTFVSVIFAGMQLVAGISLILTVPMHGVDFNFSTADIGVASNDENIFVFMVDAASNVMIEQTLNSHPDMLDNFNDFTRFTNYSTYVYGTKPSATMHLTGYTDYDIEQIPSTFFDDAWSYEDGFHNLLLENNYKSYAFAKGNNLNLAMEYSQVSPFIENAESMSSFNVQVDLKHFIKMLGKLTIYKYSPTVIKPYFTVATTDFDSIVMNATLPTATTSDEIIMLHNTLNNTGLNYIDEKVFSYYHFQGAHSPYYLTADGTRGESTVDVQINETFEIINNFMQDLKAANVYDNSTIIILADHGDYNYTSPGNSSCALFIKNKGETHDVMQINDSPVSIFEYNATLSSIIAGDDADFGDTFYDIPNSPRERTTYQYGYRATRDPETYCHDALFRVDFTGHVNDLAIDTTSEDVQLVNIGNCLYDQEHDATVNVSRDIEFVLK